MYVIYEYIRVSYYQFTKLPACWEGGGGGGLCLSYGNVLAPNIWPTWIQRRCQTHKSPLVKSQNDPQSQIVRQKTE